MEEQKKNEGVSVKDIETFAKKNRFELFFLFSIILATFFSFVFFSPGWSILFTAIGALLGGLFTEKLGRTCKALAQFVFKQEHIVQFVLGGVLLILSIFLPPLIFFQLGIHGGMQMKHILLEKKG